MQRFVYILVLICFKEMLSLSQDNIAVLHPVVGKIIDNNEKTHYLSFPEIEDTVFNYGYIRQSENNYCLKYHLLSGSVLSRIIDTAEIQQYRLNIEKLSAYYSYLLDSNSLRGSEMKLNIIEMNKPYTIKVPEPSMVTNSKWDDEYRANQRLKDDEEIRRLWRQGSNIDNAGNYIDFSYGKKRRK
jgi:hypothetical protein